MKNPAARGRDIETDLPVRLCLTLQAKDLPPNGTENLPLLD